MKIDDLLAALPAPETSGRLDLLETAVRQLVQRRRRMLRKVGLATQAFTVLCVVSASFYWAQSHERDVANQWALQQALSQDLAMTALE